VVNLRHCFAFDTFDDATSLGAREIENFTNSGLGHTQYLLIANAKWFFPASLPADTQVKNNKRNRKEAGAWP